MRPTISFFIAWLLFIIFMTKTSIIELRLSSLLAVDMEVQEQEDWNSSFVDG